MTMHREIKSQQKLSDASDPQNVNDSTDIGKKINANRPYQIQNNNNKKKGKMVNRKLSTRRLLNLTSI